MLGSANLVAQEKGKPIEPMEQHFQKDVTLKGNYRYLLYLPNNYGVKADKKWPLVVFLHGAGERGDDLNKLKVHGPPRLLQSGQDLGAIVVAPQVPAGSIWNPHVIKALVDDVKTQYAVDYDRVYLTGLSMGGYGTWDTIFEYPDVFAAAAPICGGAGVRFVMLDRIKKMPIWIFHGAKDTVVEPIHSQKIFSALEKAKAPVKFTLYPEAAHDSWTATYNSSEFWTWLFSQKRGSK